MKKKIILSSVLSIVLCICLIAGSTFALFTSSDTVDVTVGAGFVDLRAAIKTDLVVWSRLETEEDSDDEYFANGGKAVVDDKGNLAISSMTPGDNVKATLTFTSNSDIETLYRIVIQSDDGIMMNALTANALINGVTVPLIGGTTPWVLLDPYELPDDVPLTISLPDTVGNEMMGQKAEVAITVEAIQGDGIIRVSTLDELVRAIAIGGNIALLAPIQIDSNLIVDNDVTIYGDISSQLTVAKNASIQVTDGGSLTVSGLVFDEGQTAGFDSNGKFVIDDLTARRTKPLFEVTAGGKLELGSGTVFKNITATSTAVVRANGTADNRSTVVFKGTMITDCVGETGAILDAASNCDVFIEEGTVISNNVSCDNANHGILKVYSGSVLTINGGLISDNIYSGNGLIGIYDTGRNSMVVMNGGIISGNSFVYGSDALIDGTDVKNGRHGLIYVHRHTCFVMNGGEITNNTLASVNCGVIDSVNSSELTPTITIKGGNVTENYAEKDGAAVEVFGSIMDTDRISVSSTAEVSGTLYNYTQVTYLDVTAYIQ